MKITQREGYIVLDGRASVRNKAKTIHPGPMDSHVPWGLNEGREIINKTNKVVTMLVVINY
jgi:hypothetical protein